MKNFLLVLLAFLPGTIRAQNPGSIETVTVLGNRNRLNTYGFVRREAETLDTALLRVVYRLTRTTVSGTDSQSSEWVLLAGSRHTRCYSSTYECADSALTRMAQNNIRVLVAPQVALEPVGEVFRDRKTNSFRVIQRFPFEKSHVVEYEESARVPAWTLYSDADTVAGYACFKARADYGGRSWTAWYSPEIAIDAGPWKFFGLPGLILRIADDTKSYAFECQSIKTSSQPVVRAVLPARRQSKEKWLRSECGFHGSPALYFSGGGRNLFYEKGSSLQLGTNWSIPYNPIEWPGNRNTADAEK